MGDGLTVAVSGGLDFSSFDGVARPHPRFSDSSYPSYGCGAARATSFGAWLGTVGFGLARRERARLETRAAMGKSAREVVGWIYL
jgi:hypothetical protein